MTAESSLYRRSPMPVNYVRNLVELMAASGIDTARLLKKAGLTHEQVFADKARLRFEQFRAVMLAGQALSGDQALGLHLGKKLALTAHGLLGYAVMSSANLAEAMSLLQRYFCTRTRLLAPTFEQDEKEGNLLFHEMMALGDIRVVYLDVIVGAVVNVMRFILGDAVDKCHLHLPYPQPAYHQSYTRLLGMPVHFNSTLLSWRIPHGLLMRAFPLADEASRAQAAAKCEEELQRLEADQDMEARVRQQLMQAEVDMPTLKQLAAQFHMTERTLRRRLDAAHTSYRTVLDDVRHMRAIRYFASRHTVQQVAWLLGYADPSNFSRAFRKWTGQTPSEYLAEKPN